MAIVQVAVVTLITGAASGIGRELAIQLARRGGQLILADLDEQGLAQTQALIAANQDLPSIAPRNSASIATVSVTGSATEAATVSATSVVQTEAHRLDVGDTQAVRHLVDETVTKHGRLDAIYNVAGIAVLAEFDEMDAQLWRKIIDINLIGVINGCQAAYPHMQRQHSGRIVNIASLAGLIPSTSMGAYSTTKAAVVMLSRVLRAEAQVHGVRVNVVCPSFVDSRIYENAIAPVLRSGNMRAMIPLPILDTDKAVAMMLRGLARDQAVIVLPGYAKLVWLLARWFPSITGLFGRDAIKRYRAAKAAAGIEGPGARGAGR